MDFQREVYSTEECTDVVESEDREVERCLDDGISSEVRTPSSMSFHDDVIPVTLTSSLVDGDGYATEETGMDWEEETEQTTTIEDICSEGDGVTKNRSLGTNDEKSSTRKLPMALYVEDMIQYAEQDNEAGHVSAYDDDTEDEVSAAQEAESERHHDGYSRQEKMGTGNDYDSAAVTLNDERYSDTGIKRKAKADDDSDDTDVEYYDRSYKGSVEEPQQTSTINPVRQPRKQQIKDVHTCPICLENFSQVQDLQQHLTTDSCQSLDTNSWNCNQCPVVCNTLEEFKVHHLGHLGKKVFSCAACCTIFHTQRLLDKHMMVDASILNKLRLSQEKLVLPDLLCRTVLDILAESINLNKPGVTQKGPHSTPQQVEQTSSPKSKKSKESEDEEIQYEDNNIDDDDINDVDEEGEEEEDDDDEVDEEDIDESNLPSEIEEDLGEAEGSEVEDFGSEDGQEASTISHPFLSSSLTDAPRTPSPVELEDSMTSQSVNSLEDAGSTAVPPSSSRRKSKRPLQVHRTAPAETESDVVDVLKIKLEPDDHDDFGAATHPLTTEKSSAVLSPLTCPMCGEVQSDEQKLGLHIAEHEKLFPFFCALCDANFMEGHLLENHVDTCHLDDLLACHNQSLQCLMCGMYFKLREALAIHIQSCRQAPSCVVCGDSFSTGTELQQHYYSHSLEERASAEFLSCSECGEVFVSTIQLRQHQNSHGTSRPYTCKDCGDTFREKKVLDRHRLVHTRPQDCKCEICGVQLLTRSGYIAHLRGHKNNESVEAQVADQLMVLLKETSKRRQTKKSRKERRGKYGRGAAAEAEKNQNLAMNSVQYLKLVDNQLTTQEMTPIKKTTKRDMDFFKKRVHSCPFCDMTFTGADPFQEHVSSVHKDQVHFDECDICHKKVYGKEYLQRHRASHGKAFTETYPCDQCSKVFRRKFSLETHKKVHTFKKFLPCDICGEEFRFINEVEKHKYREHRYDRIQTLFECNLCKVKFGTLSHLNVHCRHTHKPEEGKPFKCANCTIVFATCTELKQHIFGSHEAGPCTGQTIKQEPEVCFEDNVDTSADKNDPLFGQVQAYVKKFVNTFPSSRSSNQNTEGVVVKMEGGEGAETEVDVYNRLTRKKMSHSTMVKRFVCETCHKCFATKSDLRTHIRTHTGETPYKCDYCDRAFKQRGHRKLHIQVAHTKIMPYTCELCNQGYPTRYRYQIHLKRHSGIKEHKCQYCDRAYYTVGKLNEHKRKNHKDELAEEQADQEL